VKKEKSISSRPLFAVPKYIVPHLGREISRIPVGHKFLLYFKGWKIGDNKREELGNVCSLGTAQEYLRELLSRQATLAVGERFFTAEAVLLSPLAVGLGNPHPVENGFSFLSPYGIPYLPGSSIKGVLRRSAEELALFNKVSKWSLPLVWLLFGFEAGSAYFIEVSENEPEPIKEEAKKWRDAFNNCSEEVEKNGLFLAWKESLILDEEIRKVPISQWPGKQGKK